MTFNSLDSLAEASNKVLISIPKKMLEDNPIDWHRISSKTLWTYRTSKRGSTRVSPYLWVGCSASNGGGSSFSKGIQEKWP